MKKLMYLIVVALILGLVLTGCSLLSNVGQVPISEQSGVAYLTKGLPFVPVGLWHFDEGTGDKAYDNSVNGNTGTLVNDPKWVAGKFGGNALKFDGVNDYVEVPDSSILEPSTITVEAWVKNSEAPGIYKYIISKVYDAKLGSYSSYAFYTGGSGGLRFYVGSASTSWVGSPDAGASLWDGNWHHIAGTYDGSKVRLFVDGEEEGTGTPTPATIAYDGGNLYIGYYGPYTHPTLTTYFPGLIDEVRIWDIALTDFQIDPVIVAMDIKPQSCPNPINVKNQGVLPVAILGTENFDVNDIDPSTILLEGVKPDRWAFEDVATPFELSTDDGEPDCFNCTKEGPDGFFDLTLKFETQEVLGAIDFGTMALIDESEIILSNNRICRVIQLTGYLYDGTPIRGEDTVLIIEKKK
jgi:hypothetical protein